MHVTLEISATTRATYTAPVLLTFVASSEIGSDAFVRSASMMAGSRLTNRHHVVGDDHYQNGCSPARSGTVAVICPLAATRPSKRD